jgi:NADH:ubiquinone oxidoreductase subunit
LSINGVLGNIYTKTDIDLSINGVLGNIYTKTDIDLSINGVLGNIYTKTDIDLSINGVLGNIYTKTDIDLSINSVLGNIYTKTDIDLSINSVLGNIYTKTDIDLSINGLFANTYTKSDIDSSLSTYYYSKSDIDSSLSTYYYSKSDIDSSLSTYYYSKSDIDSSLSTYYYSKSGIDSSLSTYYYSKSDIDSSLSTYYYSKSGIDSSLSTYYYSKSGIDSSLSTYYYSKSGIDSSLSTYYYSKSGIDSSLSTYYYSKSGIDSSLSNYYYNKSTIDSSINSILSFYLQHGSTSDVSLNGNVQLGNGSKNISINKTANLAYALDVSGILNATSVLINGATISASLPGYSANTFSFDTSFNSNVQIGNTTVQKSLGINRTADPAYSLDISGDVRIIETGLGTAASATTGTLVLSHTAANGRSSITFTSPNSGNNDYGYIQYFDNSNSKLTNETNGGLMVLGVESVDGSGNTSDRISLFAANGNGNVGVNTQTPEYHLDVSGTLRYSAVSENIVPIAAGSGTTPANTITLIYGMGDGTINGMVRYITTAISANQALDISNIPAIANRSYVFTFIYNAAATTNYITPIRIRLVGTANSTTITPKGTVTAPTTAVGFFIQQFYVFIVDTTTIANNIVFQTLTS